MHSKNYYIKLRNKYPPKKLRVIFVLESPPASGKFFYDPKGKITEPLFSAMMRCVLEFKSKNKEEGLKKFADESYFLVDAIYKPINNIKGAKERNDKILKNYPNLVRDLKEIIRSRKVKIILVKANVCRLLENRLKKNGFKVINDGLIIPFPACSWQHEFCRKIKKVLAKIRFKRNKPMKKKLRECRCTSPICGKCLVKHCQDDNCKVHTIANKIKRRRSFLVNRLIRSDVEEFRKEIKRLERLLK